MINNNANLALKLTEDYAGIKKVSTVLDISIY